MVNFLGAEHAWADAWRYAGRAWKRGSQGAGSAEQLQNADETGRSIKNSAHGAGSLRGLQNADEAGRTIKDRAQRSGFLEQLQNVYGVSGASRTEAYQEYLQQRYGGVRIQDVGKDQKSMDSIGAGTSGTGNVIIAPNILKLMADDPEKAKYYEGKIQHYFDTLPACQAQLSAMGHEIHSSGIVIHPDGTVTHYVSGDLKPEVRAKIEARIKAETEAKAERKRQYLLLSQEAAQKRNMETEIIYSQQWMAELFSNQAWEGLVSDPRSMAELFSNQAWEGLASGSSYVHWIH